MLRTVILGSASGILVCLAAGSAAAQTVEDGQGAIEITEPGAPQSESQPAYPQKGAQPPRSGQPRVGRKAAEKYMSPNASPNGSASNSNYSAPASRGDHYLALHVGTFISDTAYKWGAADTSDNVGKYTVGVTYRVGEWTNSMDLAIRLDVNGYSLNEGKASKLSFLPVVTFPEANSKFPLYFGAGIGAGVFINQLKDESSLAFDYQLMGGVRFFDVFQNTGFFLEAGIKNHIFLLSDGQFNGTYAALGTVFTF